jgi:hypothetical protein
MEDASVLDNIQGLVHFFNIVLKARSVNPEESDPMHEDPIIAVDSLADEYRHIVGERCPCGGVYVSNRQSTALSAMGQFDDINAACRECGSNHLFKFFLGSPSPRPQLSTA